VAAYPAIVSSRAAAGTSFFADLCKNVDRFNILFLQNRLFALFESLIKDRANANITPGAVEAISIAPVPFRMAQAVCAKLPLATGQFAIAI
jgi:hypothetical protein